MPGTFNAKTQFGAVADGATDDSAAVAACLDAAKAARGAAYFPTGTYLTGHRDMDGYSHMLIAGDGAALTTFRRKPLAGGMWSFTNPTKLVLQDFGWDANGVVQFGGTNFQYCDDVRLSRCSWTDSAPIPDNGRDKYGPVFRHRTPDDSGNPVGDPNNRIYVYGCSVTNLQTEVGDARNVEIIGNTFTNGRETAGLAVSCLGKGRVFENYVVRGNKITCNDAGGVLFNIDVDGADGCSFLNNLIEWNYIEVSASNRRGISIGSTKSVPITGTVWNGLTVRKNGIRMTHPTGAFQAIAVLGNSGSGNLFQGLLVEDNACESLQNSPEWTLDFQNVTGGVIRDNELRYVKTGIQLTRCDHCTVTGNEVYKAASGQLQLNTSNGDNSGSGNPATGGGAAGWAFSGANTPQGSDAMVG